MSVTLLSHRIGEPADEIRITHALQVVEREPHNRISALMGPVASIAGVPYGQPLEQAGVVLSLIDPDGDLEEALQHGEIERLAEPTRPAEQRDRGTLVEHVGDKHRLVDEHRGLGHTGEAIVADGQYLVARPVGQAHVAFPEYAVFEHTRRLSHRRASFPASPFAPLYAIMIGSSAVLRPKAEPRRSRGCALRA